VRARPREKWEDRAHLQGEGRASYSTAGVTFAAWAPRVVSPSSPCGRQCVAASMRREGLLVAPDSQQLPMRVPCGGRGLAGPAAGAATGNRGARAGLCTGGRRGRGRGRWDPLSHSSSCPDSEQGLSYLYL
jgi:hypothetical protein